MRKKGKNSNLKKSTILSILAILFVFASCNVDEVIPAEGNNERIDLRINGDITSNLNEQSSDLAEYTLNTTPVLNTEERKVTVDLGFGNSLDLIFYNRNFNDPLEETFQYGAFSLDLLGDRMAYVVADYYSNGVKKYSTISSVVKGIAQYNVVRANDKGNYYLFNIENINLYEVSNEDLRPKAKSIELNGTFTLQK
ncbi:MAG: hypothetical protein R2728_04750 [Chitinophagales bacterium]